MNALSRSGVSGGVTLYYVVNNGLRPDWGSMHDFYSRHKEHNGFHWMGSDRY